MEQEPQLDWVIDELPVLQRSLRIALVTETYPPEVNGVANTVSRMAAGLQQRGHRLQIVRLRQPGVDDCSGDPASGDDVLMRGVRIPRYPQLRMGVPCVRALCALWARQRPDVVHIATEGPLGWSALKAARKLKLPVVSDFRTNFHAYSQFYGIGWLQKPIVAYLRKFHNLTQRTMVPTQALRRELQSLGFANLSVVARGVDTHLFRPERRSAELRQQWGADDDTLVMICVGRLAAEKNLSLVHQAYSRLLQSGQKIRLVLVGEGPQQAELVKAWPDVVFAGLRRGEDLAAHYASADLFVFASLTETFGNVVTEALASGLPLVAFEHAAAAELVRHGHNGWLATPGQPEQFLACVQTAAQDASARQAIAREARRTALAQDWSQVVDGLESVLYSAVQERLAGERLIRWQPVAG